ncbi:MAG: DUF6036 family nucleotidyltransferase [Angustibacter sp.]
MPGPLLDAVQLRRIFTRLGERLSARGVIGDIYVFGGAAMALAYDSRRVTRDVDSLMVPHGVVLDEARKIAREFSLPDSWLNEQASSYVSSVEDTEQAVVFDSRGLRVSVASPRHLLAMKVMAGRRRDAEDLATLIGVLGLHSSESVYQVCREVFPHEEVPARAKLIVEDYFETELGSDAGA